MEKRLITGDEREKRAREKAKRVDNRFSTRVSNGEKNPEIIIITKLAIALLAADD